MKTLILAYNKAIAEEFRSRLAERPDRRWTEEQAAFIAAVQRGDSSILGEAVAGSGKTTTMLATVPPYADARTLHSLGLAAWQAKTGRRPNIDPQKISKIKSIPKDIFWDVISLVSAAKNAGLTPRGAPPPLKSLLPDEPESWQLLADTYTTSDSPEIFRLAHEILCESISAAYSGTLDFDDMLYMPTCYGGVFHRYETVFVDEAQDLSPIQHEMLLRVMHRTNPRLIACGDRYQSIYGFRGASVSSIPDLAEQFSMQEYPLTISFRCAKAIVAEAQKIVPHIRPAPNAPEGEVSFPETLRLSELPHTILCRNNAPLVDLALRLIASGRPAALEGRDIGKALVATINRASEKQNLPLPRLISALENYIEEEISRKPRRAEALRDREAAILALISHAENLSPHPDTKFVKRLANELYKKQNAKYILSTIHRAKGREWPEVCILDPHLIPSKYAKQPWELEQERNLLYVAVTRAQHKLVYATSEGIENA